MTGLCYSYKKCYRKKLYSEYEKMIKMIRFYFVIEIFYWKKIYYCEFVIIHYVFHTYKFLSEFFGLIEFFSSKIVRMKTSVTDCMCLMCIKSVNVYAYVCQDLLLVLLSFFFLHFCLFPLLIHSYIVVSYKIFNFQYLSKLNKYILNRKL